MQNNCYCIVLHPCWKSYIFFFVLLLLKHAKSLTFEGMKKKKGKILVEWVSNEIIDFDLLFYAFGIRFFVCPFLYTYKILNLNLFCSFSIVVHRIQLPWHISNNVEKIIFFGFVYFFFNFVHLFELFCYTFYCWWWKTFYK